MGDREVLKMATFASFCAVVGLSVAWGIDCCWITYWFFIFYFVQADCLVDYVKNMTWHDISYFINILSWNITNIDSSPLHDRALSSDVIWCQNIPHLLIANYAWLLACSSPVISVSVLVSSQWLVLDRTTVEDTVVASPKIAVPVDNHIRHEQGGTPLQYNIFLFLLFIVTTQTKLDWLFQIFTDKAQTLLVYYFPK